MKKPCCIDDANITPKSSSCSMVLRSACSHGHSHKSLVVSEVSNQEVNHQKGKSKKNLNQGNISESDSSEFSSYLQSSWKRLAYKSAKTYSILKEGLYNHFEHSETPKLKFLNKDEVLAGPDKEIHFNRVSAPANSFLNNNSISQEEFSSINNCITTNYSAIMSRSREFSRSISGSNVLSESEAEEDSTKDKRRKKRYIANSRSRSSVGENEFLESNNNSNIKVHAFETTTLSQRTSIPVSNVNHQTTWSSHVGRSEFNSPGSDASGFSSEIDISTVQYTPIDRFRWFLWRSVYLKIIKCVNFDVWLLSRLQKYKKCVISLLLLPLLICFLYAALLKDSRNKSFDDLSSNILSFSSLIYSSISSPFVYNEEISSGSSSEEASYSIKFTELLYAIFLAISNFFSNFFIKVSDPVSMTSKQPLTELKNKIGLSKEELKFMVDEVLKEKYNDIKIQNFQFKSDDLTKNEKSLIALQSEFSNLGLEFKSLLGSVQKLEKYISEKTEGSSLQYEGMREEHNVLITSMNTKMKDIEDKLLSLDGIMKNCCEQKMTISEFESLFEGHFLAALKSVVGRSENRNAPYYFFSEWIQSKLANDKENLSSELKSEFEKFKKEQDARDIEHAENIQTIMKNVKQYVESLRKNLTVLNKEDIIHDHSYSIDFVRKIVKEGLMLYDADKTGLVDYALESGGGSVLSTRCSESYAERDGTISVFGLPLWTTHNSPRTAIQPNMQPGQCWAFKGSHGFLVIQLAYTIYPTGFTLEHIPVSLSPSGSIDSAPNDFSVWGLVSEKDNEGKLLGKYSYDQDRDPLQYVAVQNTYTEPFSFVELKIHSNHGNLDYTCLYRFRVHGSPTKM